MKTMLMLSSSLAVTLTLALVACGDDANGSDGAGAGMSTGTGVSAGPSLSERVEALATCTPTDLVQVLPWSGAAFDPETAELTAPLPEGHIEAVVNGWSKYDDAAIALRTEHGQKTAADVFSREGLLGFQAVESVECGISISHTLWRDEAAMFAFVAGDAHAAAMADTARVHEATAGAHWSSPARAVAPTWKEGIDRYVQEMRAELAD